MPFLLVPVYKIFGKVGTAAIPLGIGLLGVASGSIGLIRKGKNTPPAAPQATTDATVEPRQNGPRSIPGFDPLP